MIEANTAYLEHSLAFVVNSLELMIYVLHKQRVLRLSLALLVLLNLLHLLQLMHLWLLLVIIYVLSLITDQPYARLLNIFACHNLSKLDLFILAHRRIVVILPCDFLIAVF